MTLRSSLLVCGLVASLAVGCSGQDGGAATSADAAEGEGAVASTPGGNTDAGQSSSSQDDPPASDIESDAGPGPAEGPPCEQPVLVDDGPALAFEGDCGRLSYTRYAARDEEVAEHRLPDFSFAG